MKIINCFVSLFCLIPVYSYSCPTCVGRVSAASPAFFSDDFYLRGKEIQRETKEQVGNNQFKKLIESKKGKK